MNNSFTGQRVFALAIDPQTSSTLYAGTTGGGVYKSVDGGTSWLASNTGMAEKTGISDLLIDPNNSSVIYASAMYSGAVYKSSDSGANWEDITGNLGNMPVLSLASDGTDIYVGTLNGVFKL